ncbi:hypothetical protein EB64_02727 [Enterococcus faecium]|nr:hypothetical protein EB64_02727 [Enterococcus faecium]
MSMFGFMAHTKQVTADTNQKERIMSQLDDSQIEYVPNELIVSLKATQRISTEKNKPQNLLGVKVMVYVHHSLLLILFLLLSLS